MSITQEKASALDRRMAQIVEKPPLRRHVEIMELLDRQRDVNHKLRRELTLEMDRNVLEMKPRVSWITWAIGQGLLQAVDEIFDWARNPDREAIQSHHGIHRRIGPDFPDHYQSPNRFMIGFHDHDRDGPAWMLFEVPTPYSAETGIGPLFRFTDEDWMAAVALVEERWGRVVDHWNGGGATSGSMKVEPLKPFPKRNRSKPRFPLPEGWFLDA